MTHHKTYFKGNWTIVVYLWLMTLGFATGCNNASNQPSDAVDKHRSELYQQTQRLVQQAHQLESQIDEVRRANPDNQAIEIEQLKKQLSIIQVEQEKLNQEMEKLRQTLKQDDDAPSP